MSNHFYCQRQHPAVWSSYAKFRLPIIIAKSLDQVQRWWNGGLKTYQTFIKNLENNLIGLPVEIILLIVSSLSPVEKLLLSLSAKRLRVILMDRFDFSLTSNEQKLEFLLILERDLPEHLTCRYCAQMFKWRSRKSLNYTCPRTNKYPAYYQPHPSKPQSICRPHQVHVSEEILHLISRAYRYGSDYGLSPSCCDHDCYRPGSEYKISPSRCDYHCDTIPEHWIRQHSKGRIVNNQFFLARSRTFPCDFTNCRNFIIHYSEEFRTCTHSFLDIISTTRESVQQWDRRQSQRLATVKCEVCATDVKVKLSSSLIDRSVEVEINIWQKIGKSLSSGGDVSTIVGMSHGLDDRDDLVKRDLEHEFTVSRTFDRV